MSEVNKARKEHIRGRLAELDAEKQALEGQLFGAEAPAPAPRPPPPVVGGAAVAPVLIVAGIGAGAAAAILGLHPGILVGGAFLVVLGISTAVARSLVVIARPDEVVVILGGARPRVIGAGSRYLRKPLVERAERMVIELPPVEGTLPSVYAKGSDVLVAVFTATVRIARSEPRVHDAIERFLGRSGAEVAIVARQTLESATRSVLAGLTAAEARHDTERLAQAVIQHAEGDLHELGLELDAFHITVRDGSAA